MIRIAKIFNGTKKKASYRTEMQYMHPADGNWYPVEEVWVSNEDEQKYNKAKEYEHSHDFR